ncbi:MAG: hypothetical protein IT463_09750 [Planctomycetes bacterium]|nr:hypothetical protein [Planctomycetota bacterium]
MIRLCLLILLGSGALAAQTYSVSSGSLSNYTALTGATTLALGDNELSAVQSPPGFSFAYFGTAYTGFKVGSNGYLVLGTQGTTTSSTPAHSTAPGLVVAPFWADLKPNLGGAIRWKYTAPVLAVEWDDITVLSPGSGSVNPPRLTMTALLDTATGAIEFQYSAPGTATAGPNSPAANTCAISGPTGTGGGQTVFPGADPGSIKPDGSVSQWPWLRFVRFTPVTTANNAPTIAVTVLTLYMPISNGQQINCSYGGLMTAFYPRITVADADGDPCSLVGNVSNVTTQGILNSEFSSASAATPYVLQPTSGQFNRAGVTHTFQFQANDGKGGTAQFAFYLTVLPAQGNNAPEVQVQAAGGAVTDGGTLNVAFGSTLAALNLRLDISDADTDSVELSAAISNVTTQGLATAEFSHSHGATPYSLFPASGTFNQGGTTHQVTLTADDYRGGVTTFGFSIVVGLAPTNNSPTLALTAGGSNVVNGSEIAVAPGSTLAALALAITVDDPDGDACSVAATITNVGTTGLDNGEFSSGSAAVPYVLQPTSGLFNAPLTTHTVTLVAQDGNGGQATFVFRLAEQAAPGQFGGGGSGGGGGCSTGSGGSALAALALLAALLLLRRRKAVLAAACLCVLPATAAIDAQEAEAPKADAKQAEAEKNAAQARELLQSAWARLYSAESNGLTRLLADAKLTVEAGQLPLAVQPVEGSLVWYSGGQTSFRSAEDAQGKSLRGLQAALTQRAAELLPWLPGMASFESRFAGATFSFTPVDTGSRTEAWDVKVLRGTDSVPEYYRVSGDSRELTEFRVGQAGEDAYRINRPCFLEHEGDPVGLELEEVTLGREVTTTISVPGQAVQTRRDLAETPVSVLGRTSHQGFSLVSKLQATLSISFAGTSAEVKVTLELSNPKVNGEATDEGLKTAGVSEDALKALKERESAK